MKGQMEMAVTRRGFLTRLTGGCLALLGLGKVTECKAKPELLQERKPFRVVEDSRWRRAPELMINGKSKISSGGWLRFSQVPVSRDECEAVYKAVLDHQYTLTRGHQIVSRGLSWCRSVFDDGKHTFHWSVVEEEI